MARELEGGASTLARNGESVLGREAIQASESAATGRSLKSLSLVEGEVWHPTETLRATRIARNESHLLCSRNEAADAAGSQTDR